MTAETSIPLGHLHKVDGVNAVLALVILTDGALTLHMTLQPCTDEFLDGWFGHPKAWLVTDDAGTAYKITNAHSRGNDGACYHSMTWAPAPPASAAWVKFEAVNEGAVALSERVNLEPRREWSRTGKPSA